MKIAISVKAFKFMVFSLMISILLPITAMAYTEHSGTISSSETWGPGTHYVTGSISVSDNQVLTIQPGAVVKFAPNTQMIVNGKLKAGEAGASGVVFTSRDDNTYGENIDGSDGVPSPGDWRGIYLYGTGDNDGVGEFDNCRVRYGGNAGLIYSNVTFYNSDSGHFINSVSEYSVLDGVLISGSSPQVTNSTIENNDRHGLWVRNDSTPVITNNTIRNNVQHPLYVNQNFIPPNISGNTISGHAINTLVFAGTIAVDQTWSYAPDFPIVLLSPVTVNDDVTLTVTAGTVIKFGPNINLTVNGSLDADGVVFTALADDQYGGDTQEDGAVTPEPGAWRGIYLYGTGDNDGVGEFDNCRVRYGGNAGFTYANVTFYNSDSGHFINSVSEYSVLDGVLISGSSPQVTNSTIENNDRHGLWVRNDSTPVITNNTIRNNVQHPLYVNQNFIPPNISGNTISGHAINSLVFNGTVAENQTWSYASDFPIVLLSPVTVNDDVTLTVTAGTVIKFGPNINLTVNGSLDADGVVFTALADDQYGGDTQEDGAVTPEPGAWRGIYLYGTGDNDGVGEFDNCRVRYGGNAGFTYANVTFYNSDSGHFINSTSEHSVLDGLLIWGSSPQINGSIIENNTRYGLYVINGGTPEIIDNTIRNNENYPLYISLNVIPPNISGNTISGHAINSLVFNGTVAENQTWSYASDFPIVLLSPVTVNDDVTLTVTAGTVIKFGPNINLTVNGSLDADGVVFTALADDQYGGDTQEDGAVTPEPGAWRGIYLYGTGDNDGVGEFDNCRVRYGGNAGFTYANVTFYNSDSGHFINSTSEHSALDGVLIWGSFPQVTNSTISNNIRYGLSVSSGTSRVINSIVWGNTLGGISGTPVVAYSDIQGGFLGEGNIDEDPQFLDPVNGDYRLDICSPAIDAGDPVEILTADYSPGQLIVNVNAVTAVNIDDIVWITDGVEFESDEVFGTTATMVAIKQGCANSYTVADRSYLYTATSNYLDEPAPSGLRINMGIYGGGSEATQSIVCRSDLQGEDQDVDGLDLREFMNAYGSATGAADINKDGTVDQNDLFMFAAEFGRTDCPVCP